MTVQAIITIRKELPDRETAQRYFDQVSFFLSPVDSFFYAIFPYSPPTEKSLDIIELKTIPKDSS